MKTSPHALSPGDLVDGRYRIIRTLGHGGMGAVYEAEHARLQRRVALKLLRPELVEHPLASRRFEREARSAAAIHHRNVVEIFDFGEVLAGGFYYAMELLEGRDLSEVVSAEGALQWWRACGIFRQIAAALVAAHATGTVHRDIKPANCFLLAHPWPDEPEPLKVLDFGIAKTEPGPRDGSALTRADDLIGSAHYMAPEQAEGRPVDARTDVYALGVTMYEVLAGRVPFEGTNAFQVLFRHTTETPAPLRSVASSCSTAVEAVVMRALEKDPARRWQTMRELADALAEVDDNETQSVGIGPSPQASHPVTHTTPFPALDFSENAARNAMARTVALSRDMSPPPSALAVQDPRLGRQTMSVAPPREERATSPERTTDRQTDGGLGPDPGQTLGIVGEPPRRRVAFLAGLALGGIAAITGGVALASVLAADEHEAAVVERDAHQAAPVPLPLSDEHSLPQAQALPDLAPPDTLTAISPADPPRPFAATLPSTSIGPLDDTRPIATPRSSVADDPERAASWTENAGALSGTIRDPLGRALVAARVCAWISDTAAPSSLRRRPSCSQSDRHGAYRIGKLVPSTYDVVASAREHLPTRFVGSAPLVVAAGMQTRGVDLQLRAGGVALRGRVHEGSGRAVPHAFVWISGSGLVQADERGAFSVWVEPGDVQATAWSPRHASATVQAAVPGNDVRIELAKQAVLTGRVRARAGGAPVANARVRAGGTTGDDAVAYSDATGVFRIEGLAPGNYRPAAETADARGSATAMIELRAGAVARDIVVELVDNPRPDPALPGTASPPPEPKPAPRRELDEDVKQRLARAIRRECGGEGISVVVEFAVIVGGEVSSPGIRSAKSGGTVPQIVQQCVARVAKKAVFPRGKFRVHTLRVAL